MPKNKRSNKGFVIFLAIVTTVSLAGLGGAFTVGNNPPPRDGAVPNDNDSPVPCLFSEVFHLHPHLTILVDGQEEAVPGNIGILPGCIKELHTHALDGIIHVEADSDKGYTFADFLGVWGVVLERPGYITRLTVNGEFNDNSPNFILEDGQQIVLEYISIPAEFLKNTNGAATSPDSQ